MVWPWKTKKKINDNDSNGEEVDHLSLYNSYEDEKNQSDDLTTYDEELEANDTDIDEVFQQGYSAEKSKDQLNTETNKERKRNKKRLRWFALLRNRAKNRERNRKAQYGFDDDIEYDYEVKKGYIGNLLARMRNRVRYVIVNYLNLNFFNLLRNNSAYKTQNFNNVYNTSTSIGNHGMFSENKTDRRNKNLSINDNIQNTQPLNYISFSLNQQQGNVNNANQNYIIQYKNTSGGAIPPTNLERILNPTMMGRSAHNTIDFHFPTFTFFVPTIKIAISYNVVHNPVNKMPECRLLILSSTPVITELSVGNNLDNSCAKPAATLTIMTSSIPSIYDI